MISNEKMDVLWEQFRILIAKIIPKEEYEYYHKSFIDMWKWLAEDCRRNKKDYFEAKHIVCDLRDWYCFACILNNKVCDELFENSNYNEELYDILKYLEGCIRACDFCPLKSHLQYYTCDPLYADWALFDEHNTLYAKEIAKAEWYSYEEYCNILRILHDYYRVGKDKT